ncbi:MAG TPA: hypothetical protein VK887_12880 [Pseudonocardiaceae bacterium]|nr:hypothetical protein [Pseudonocardiaceae bacterium]
MGKHSQDNDEDGYWPKQVPKEDRSDDSGKHDAGKQDDDKQDDDER